MQRPRRDLCGSASGAWTTDDPAGACFTKPAFEPKAAAAEQWKKEMSHALGSLAFQGRGTSPAYSVYVFGCAKEPVEDQAVPLSQGSQDGTAQVTPCVAQGSSCLYQAIKIQQIQHLYIIYTS